MPNNELKIITAPTMNIAVELMDDVYNGWGKQGRWQYFTVGEKGKKHYHFWTPGKSGLYYIFRCMPNGHPGCKRAIEANTQIKIYIKPLKLS